MTTLYLIRTEKKPTSMFVSVHHILFCIFSAPYWIKDKNYQEENLIHRVKSLFAYFFFSSNYRAICFMDCMYIRNISTGDSLSLLVYSLSYELCNFFELLLYYREVQP